MLKTIVLVDFDNIYSGIKKIDAGAANVFASYPQTWMQWLVSQFPMPEGESAHGSRRLLVRRCYMNPAVFRSFRQPFVCAGFDVIECPPMTLAGKTSTDIQLAVDAIDLMHDPVHFDEVILFSADADFAPVLRKLRQKDRRTAMLAFGYSSSSYAATADQVIDSHAFLKVLKDKESKIVASQHRTVVAPVERIAIPLSPDTSSIVDSIVERGHLDIPTSKTPVVAAEPSSPGVRTKEMEQVKVAAEAAIRSIMETARGPVDLSKIGSLLRQKIRGIEKGWGGMGTCKALLRTLDIAPSEILWSQHGAVIVHPGRPAYSSPASFKSQPVPLGADALPAIE